MVRTLPCPPYEGGGKNNTISGQSKYIEFISICILVFSLVESSQQHEV